jgi:hypothetical protein
MYKDGTGGEKMRSDRSMRKPTLMAQVVYATLIHQLSQGDGINNEGINNLAGINKAQG